MNPLIQVRPPGSHASTFGSNALACAAGAAVLELAGEPGFGKRVSARGAHLLDGLRELAGEVPLIGDVRRIGLMCGIELVKDPVTKEPAAEERDGVLNEAFERGLVLLPAGESVIRFCPPLIISDGEIDAGLAIPHEAFAAVEAAHG